MNSLQEPEDYIFTKTEVVALVSFMKLYSMSMASAFMAAVDSGAFDCEEKSDYFSLVVMLEKIKFTHENIDGFWGDDEIEVKEWVKDALEV